MVQIHSIKEKTFLDGSHAMKFLSPLTFMLFQTIEIIYFFPMSLFSKSTQPNIMEKKREMEITDSWNEIRTSHHVV
jgi:hypothetical protein